METTWISIGSFVVSIVAIVISVIALCVKKKQYLSNIRPELFLENCISILTKNQVNLVIGNRSENTAIVKNMIPHGKNISLRKPFHRYELTNKNNLTIECDYHGQSMFGDKFKLKINYTDREGNAYTAFLYVNEKGSWIE